jgi:transcription antitermination factor NusG
VAAQLARKGYEVFLPTVPRWSRWKDRRKKISWPLFPGYVLARFDSASTLPILNCAGVVSIVSFNAEAAQIPADEVESIRLLVQSELQFDPCPFIRDGMLVEVVHGPLRGVVGRLMRRDRHRTKLFLSVDLIGQGVSVEVDAADVIPRSA